MITPLMRKGMIEEAERLVLEAGHLLSGYQGINNYYTTIAAMKLRVARMLVDELRRR